MCRPNERTHKHHIIPRYMRGPDTPENLVEVTVTQHAMFHFCNYQLWGNEEDRIAWRAISGQIDVDEIKREVQLLGARKGGQITGHKHKENGTGIFKMTPEEKSEVSKRGGLATYENGTGVFAMTLEQLSEAGKKAGQQHKENGTGLFGMTPEQKSERSKKIGQQHKENGTGLFGMTPEQKSERSKKIGQQHKENGTGVCGITFEQRSKNSKKMVQKHRETGTGIFGLTPQQRSEKARKAAKAQNAQKYQCTITGFVSTASGLTSYQRKRGIDTSNRIRIQ